MGNFKKEFKVKKIKLKKHVGTAKKTLKKSGIPKALEMESGVLPVKKYKKKKVITVQKAFHGG